MRRIQSGTYDRPWLLLCEGEGDRKFFNRLIAHHNIGIDQFDVKFPGREDDPTGGLGKFGATLSTAHTTAPTFREVVKAVLIVADNDDAVADSPQNSFKLVQKELEKANFPVPDKEQVVARKDSYPTVAVLMVPIGAHGNLETMCVTAALNKWANLAAPLNTYMAATPAAGWRLGKQSKMRMHALLAATCEQRPDTSFHNHWQLRPEFHVPIGDPIFNPIVAFLNGFGALLLQNP